MLDYVHFLACGYFTLLAFPVSHTHTHTGAAGGTFAAGACMTARFRDKDDYVNAAVGGLLAGAVFGLKCKAI